MPVYPSDSNDTVVYNGIDLYVPKDCSVTVFEDSRVFLFGEWYLNGLPLMSGSGTTSGTEVSVGPTPPVDPGVLLWFDTSAGYGELKAKVGGTFKTVEDPSDFVTYDEVAISSVEPTNPNVDLWFDTSVNVPNVGYTYQGNALGVIAIATFINSGINTIPVSPTYNVLTNQLACTLYVGRRYRVGLMARAFAPSSGGVPVSANFFLQDLGADTAFINTWSASAGNFDNVNIWCFIDGDGLNHGFTFKANGGGANTPTPGQVMSIYGGNGSYAYVEDVGPNQAPAQAIPDTPPAWIGATVNTGGGWTVNVPLQYRKIGDVVYTRGTVNGSTATTNPITTFPAGFVPPTGLRFATTTGGAVPLALVLNTDGTLTASGFASGTLAPFGLQMQWSVTP